MKLTQQTVVAILAAIALIGAIVIVLTSKVVPDQLWSLAYVLVGAAAGVAIPSVVTAVKSAPAAPATTEVAAVPVSTVPPTNPGTTSP